MIMQRRGRAAVLVAGFVAFAAPALAAQKTTDPMLPLPETSQRLRQLEPPAQPGRIYEVWKVGAPPEMMLGWYLRKLNRLSPLKNGVLDTAKVIMGDTRPPMSYVITFHKFDDECADSSTTTASSDAPAACTRWKLGKDKRRLLDNNRVNYELGEWIERVTFMWYVRELNGELVRRRIELRDVGISDDWKRYTLVSRITLERDVLQPATASP